jgi:4-amino-4-deoxy-L-arabinose transferase-like glycosyltransferase
MKINFDRSIIKGTFAECHFGLNFHILVNFLKNILADITISPAIFFKKFTQNLKNLCSKSIRRQSLKKDWFLLTAVVALALALRIWFMSLLPCLNFDEVVSFFVAQKPFGQIWDYVKWEMHPPLHYYFLHFWFQLFGATEISAHFSSIFLSILAVIALYFLGKEIFSSGRAGLAAAALYAFSPLFCFFGVWTRMYTMLFLTAALSFLFFFQLLKARGQPAALKGALFVSFTLAALFTHLTAGLVVAIEFAFLVYLVVAQKNKIGEIVKKFIIPAAIIALAYGWWFWHFWQFRFRGLGADAWYFHEQGKANFLYILFYDSLKYLTPFDEYFFNSLALALLVILGFSAFVAIIPDKEKGWKIKSNFSSGAFFALLVFFVSFLGLFATKLLVLRYAIMPAIGFFLLLGYGFYRASRSLRVAFLVLYLILAPISFISMGRAPLYAVSWKGAADFIKQNERPGDKIIAPIYSDLLPIDFYYQGKLPVTSPLDEKYRGDDLLLTVIKTNIYQTINRENIGALDGYLSGARRIFLFVSNGNGSFPQAPKIAEEWLAGRGFARVQVWPPGDASSSLVWLMEKKQQN